MFRYKWIAEFMSITRTHLLQRNCLLFRDAHGTIQYNTIQHNTTQHNTTQHNTTQHNTTQHNTIQ